MNNKQRLIILTAVALIALISIFPPWTSTRFRQNPISGNYDVPSYSSNAGHHLVLSPPQPYVDDNNELVTFKIELIYLLIWWFFIIVAAGVFYNVPGGTEKNAGKDT